MGKLKKTNRTSIGGQAVLEGVMMRGSTSMATSVRDEDGNIRVETERIKSAKEKPLILRLPIIRGVVNLVSSMTMGSKILMRSAEVYGEQEPSKFEKWLSKTFKIDLMNVVMGLSLILGLALAIGLFMWLPQFLTGLLAPLINIEKTSIWFNLIEGLVKMLVFVCYILLTSLLKDIKRTFMYHGAEHKTISCYECGLELTVENVKKCSRIHDRCGTTFMFLVMFISIIVFSLVNGIFQHYDIQVEKIWRVLLKIGLLPIVAGISYEILKLLSKTDSVLVLPIKWPGMLLQRITTKEPDDGMIEVAINSFKTVLQMDADPTIEPQKFVTAMPCDKLLAEVEKTLKDAGIEDKSDSEWIVAIASSKKRSEIVELKKNLSPSIVERALDWAKKRAQGEPLWYVIGDTEFYGYKIKVDSRVLIPRPETEELVLNAKKHINNGHRVLDMCTGSGAIAIAIKLETGATVDAADVSEDALAVAKENAKLNGADINFIHSDLFENIDGVYDFILSNPPYVKTEDIKNLQPEVKREPILALDGGSDGLAVYRLIAQHFDKYLAPNGTMYLECGQGQAQDICNIFASYKTQIINDLNGVDRIVVIQKQ